MHKNFKCSLRCGSINCVVPVFEYIECYIGDGEYSVLIKTRENTHHLYHQKSMFADHQACLV